jgi:hypothetical protein
MRMYVDGMLLVVRREDRIGRREIGDFGIIERRHGHSREREEPLIVHDGHVGRMTLEPATRPL